MVFLQNFPLPIPSWHLQSTGIIPFARHPLFGPLLWGQQSLFPCECHLWPPPDWSSVSSTLEIGIHAFVAQCGTYSCVQLFQPPRYIPFLGGGLTLAPPEANECTYDPNRMFSWGFLGYSYNFQGGDGATSIFQVLVEVMKKDCWHDCGGTKRKDWELWSSAEKPRTEVGRRQQTPWTILSPSKEKNRGNVLSYCSCSRKGLVHVPCIKRGFQVSGTQKEKGNEL